jgi:DNA-binding response OmpR family regulator
MNRILVVDDEVEIVDFLCTFLKRFDLESNKAFNGQEALDVYDKIKPDWLLLDLKMPQMDGLQVLKEFKNRKQKVNVIMITGRDDKELQKEAKALGAKDYIVKPLDLEELHQKIEKYILSPN